MTLDADALIVGIDRYDNANIQTLDGCVNDARDVARWLINIGVNSKRITAHVSAADPKSFPEGVVLKPATDKTIRASFKALSKGRGDQLFLFFSGHGKSVPGFGPIFLCQDYYVDESPRENLAIRQYIDWLLSWNYRDQFLFYDACQDPTASVGQIGPVEPSGPDAQPGSFAANPNAALTVCYACSEGETTWAGDGRGVLVRSVLAAIAPAAWTDLDPDAPEQDAVDYSWKTGARAVDLERLFTNTIAQRIRDAAAAANKFQTPFCQPYGRVLKDGWSPILALPALPLTDVTIDLTPATAFPDLRSITLRSQMLSKPCFLPFRDMALQVPTQLKFPLDDQINARCLLKGGSAWQAVNVPVMMKLAQPTASIVFECSQSPPGPPPPDHGLGEINVTADGSPNPPSPAIVAEFQRLAGTAPPGINFSKDQNGANISFDPSNLTALHQANDIAVGWLKDVRRINQDPAMRVILSPVGQPKWVEPNVYFDFGKSSAADIAGYLENDECVSIESLEEQLPPRRLSLRDLESHPYDFIEPGQFRVSIDLPWGRWTRRFRAGEKILVVALPISVGLEPLRNRFRRDDPSAPVLIVDPRLSPMRLLRPVGFSDGTRFWGFADLPVATLVLKTEDGLRIEAFSETTLRQWDELVTVGRLDVEDAAGLVKRLDGELPGGTVEEFALFALAAAYAERNRRNWSGVQTILDAIKGFEFRPLDVTLLRLTLEIENGSLTGEERQEAVAAALLKPVGLLPLLRWGVELLVELIGRTEIPVPRWVSDVDPTAVVTVLHDAGMKDLGYDMHSLARSLHAQRFRKLDLTAPTPPEQLREDRDTDRKDLPSGASGRLESTSRHRREGGSDEGTA